MKTAEFILENSKTLIEHNCVIFDNVLYERLSAGGLYRFFIDVDDYDYLEPDFDAELIERLDEHFMIA